MTVLVVDEKKCGIGQGEKCCAFLGGMPGRFVCGREMENVADTIRDRLREGTINARYDPGETPYPECQERRMLL
jgi:hypothetical protein